MNINNIKVFQYDLDLERSLFVKGQEMLTRSGCLLELSSGDSVGYGEVAPLPGFSDETLSDAIDQVTRLSHFLKADPLPENLEELSGQFDEWLGNLSLYPSVAFGVEMAVLNLMANRDQVTLSELLSETNHTHIPINGLLQGNKMLIEEQAAQLVAAGFTAIKLKVGTDIDKDIERVRCVSQALNGKALLHLDANQAWTLDEAIHFGNEVGLATVDYIEEPLKDYKDVPEFFHQTTIPVALDETVRVIDFQEIKKIEGVDVLVLKPSVIGGIEKTWRIVRDAKGQGISTLISSIFESSVGLLCLANLAGCSFRNNAAGLDTAKWLKNDLLLESLDIQRGRMEVAGRLIRKDSINFDCLTEVKIQ